MNANICLVTGIYPPDIGGPAKFAESFALWNTSSNQNTINLSYTSGPSLDSVNLNNRIILISRKYNIFSRYLRMIIQILRISNKKNRSSLSSYRIGFHLQRVKSVSKSFL